MTKTINWIFLIAGTFIMIYVMASTGSSLTTEKTPHGILDLEFAYNATKARDVMQAWVPHGSERIDNIRVAIRNTWLDFIFLFFYSLFLFYTCKTIADSFTGFLYRLGRFLALAALNAGLLDIAENAGMLVTLNGFSTNSISFFTTLFSVIKWILALSALAYVLIAGTYLLLTKMKK